jgi:excisionase family DNA binding protein
MSNIDTPLRPLAVSPNKAAALTGLHHSQIQKAIRNHELPVAKIGTKKRVLISDLEDFLRSHQAVAA